MHITLKNENCLNTPMDHRWNNFIWTWFTDRLLHGSRTREDCWHWSDNINIVLYCLRASANATIWSIWSLFERRYRLAVIMISTITDKPSTLLCALLLRSLIRKCQRQRCADTKHRNWIMELCFTVKSTIRFGLPALYHTSRRTPLFAGCP